MVGEILAGSGKSCGARSRHRRDAAWDWAYPPRPGGAPYRANMTPPGAMLESTISGQPLAAGLAPEARQVVGDLVPIRVAIGIGVGLRP